jgi:transposase
MQRFFLKFFLKNNFTSLDYFICIIIGVQKKCINYFKNWCINVVNSQIRPMITAADTILNHIESVINVAVTLMSNAIAENINSKIQIIKDVGIGYKNINGYRNAILFFNGNLELIPP